MNNKLTINLDKMKQGHNGVTGRPYLWTIVDEDKNNMYEVQIIKLNFPSSIKDIRSGKAVGSDVLQRAEYSGHKIVEVTKKHYGKANN